MITSQFSSTFCLISFSACLTETFPFKGSGSSNSSVFTAGRAEFSGHAEEAPDPGAGSGGLCRHGPPAVEHEPGPGGSWTPRQVRWWCSKCWTRSKRVGKQRLLMLLLPAAASASACVSLRWISCTQVWRICPRSVGGNWTSVSAFSSSIGRWMTWSSGLQRERWWLDLTSLARTTSMSLWVLPTHLTAIQTQTTEKESEVINFFWVRHLLTPMYGFHISTLYIWMLLHKTWLVQKSGRAMKKYIEYKFCCFNSSFVISSWKMTATICFFIGNNPSTVSGTDAHKKNLKVKIKTR